MFYSTELLSSSTTLGKLWLLGIQTTKPSKIKFKIKAPNLPSQLNKSQLESISIAEGIKAITSHPDDLSLRLYALLLFGLLKLYELKWIWLLNDLFSVKDSLIKSKEWKIIDLELSLAMKEGELRVDELKKQRFQALTLSDDLFTSLAPYTEVVFPPIASKSIYLNWGLTAAIKPPITISELDRLPTARDQIESFITLPAPEQPRLLPGDVTALNWTFDPVGNLIDTTHLLTTTAEEGWLPEAEYEALSTILGAEDFGLRTPIEERERMREREREEEREGLRLLETQVIVKKKRVKMDKVIQISEEEFERETEFLHLKYSIKEEQNKFEAYKKIATTLTLNLGTSTEVEPINELFLDTLEQASITFETFLTRPMGSPRISEEYELEIPILPEVEPYEPILEEPSRTGMGLLGAARLPWNWDTTVQGERSFLEVEGDQIYEEGFDISQMSLVPLRHSKPIKIPLEISQFIPIERKIEELNIITDDFDHTYYEIPTELLHLTNDSLNFLDFIKLNLPIDSKSISFNQLIDKMKLNLFETGLAFYHLLELKTKSLIDLNQLEPYTELWIILQIL